jgi:hypothetical protein
MHVNQLLRKLRSITTIFAIGLILASCASTPKVFTNENPQANFQSYKTYNFEAMLGTDERKGYRSILSNHMIDATNTEMRSRGYTLSDSPDLIINFYVHTQEKIRTTSSPSMGGYYGYRGSRYGAYGGYDTQVTQYTEGTLNIDLVDNAAHELAWEGVTVGRITDKVKENLKAAVHGAVAVVFDNFPHYAPGFVPPTPPQGD